MPRLRDGLVSLACAIALTASACGGGERAQRTTPTSPTAASAATPGSSGGPATTTRVPASPGFTPMAAGGDDIGGTRDVAFPPRDQPFDFRQQLEAKYRDQLKRQATSSYVDVEGDIVWTQEYLRYRVNACNHAEAVDRVFLQIDGRGIQPVCGAAPAGNVAFPPRDQPFDFRQQLEAKYRDQLKRPAASTYVDVEGDIVWTQEYLRYRVNGCNHAEAVDRVFLQIDGRGIQPVCQTVVVPPPTPPPTTGPPSQVTQSYTGSMSGVASDGQGGTQVPYNLTLLLKLLAGGGGSGEAAGTRATPIYAVTGTYEAADGRTGTVAGQLVGLPSNGDFQGELRCSKSGCAATRTFSGPLTSSSIRWGAMAPPANT